LRNRIVGILVIGIAALMGFIIFSFNTALTNVVNTACTHGTACPMWGTIEFQTNLSIAITIVVLLIGLYLVFFGEEQKIITKIRTFKPPAAQVEPKKITVENYRKVLSGLNADERVILEKVIEAQGTLFQSEVVDKTGFTKVKVTRILDGLEGRGLIERRRRGMTNVVVLKSR
jgi:uncharacterized membrane protein